MQGAGNDFVVLDNRNLIFTLDELVGYCPQLCDRRFGIGADGLLALFPADDTTEADFKMVYRNADGSDAGMCGNGARCLSAYAHQKGIPAKHRFVIHGNVYQATVQAESDHKCNVTVSFPIETSVETSINGLCNVYTATEHVVLFADAAYLLNEPALIAEGKSIRYDTERYPKGTNVNFVSGIDPNHLHIQTYERGVENLTLACGTGAIASAIAWHHHIKSDRERNEMTVRCKGGELKVGFVFHKSQNKYAHISLSGDAVFVFEGSYLFP